MNYGASLKVVILVGIMHASILHSLTQIFAPTKKNIVFVKKPWNAQVGTKPTKKIQQPLPSSFITFEGVPVVKSGVFLPGCEYGPLASLSDHAPVIWEGDGVATWNITNRVSHVTVKVGKQSFMSHRFRTDEHGVLVDKLNRPVIQGHASETDTLSQSNVVNQYYLIRLKRIAREIKNMFRTLNINAMAIQEIPHAGLRDVDGNAIQAEFADALGSEYVVHYPETIAFNRAQIGFEKALDVAIIAPRTSGLTRFPPDLKNRIQPFCDTTTMECIASAHLPFVATDEAQAQRCTAMVSHVKTLFDRGFKTVKVLGDFNASAAKLYRSCRDIFGFQPVIKVSSEKPQSCSSNDGAPSPVTIDFLLVFTKPE